MEWGCLSFMRREAANQHCFFPARMHLKWNCKGV